MYESIETRLTYVGFTLQGKVSFNFRGSNVIQILFIFFLLFTVYFIHLKFCLFLLAYWIFVFPFLCQPIGYLFLLPKVFPLLCWLIGYFFFSTVPKVLLFFIGLLDISFSLPKVFPLFWLLAYWIFVLVFLKNFHAMQYIVA